MTDFSTPEGKALFENEVRKRMEAPPFMTRDQAEILVAVLLWEVSAVLHSDHDGKDLGGVMPEDEGDE